MKEQQRRIGKTMRILANRMARRLDGRIAREVSAEMSGLQGRVLGFIRFRSSNGEVFQKDIEEEFGIRRSTVSGMLQLMEKKGLVQRQAAVHDARLKKIVLTESAAQTIRQVWDVIEGWENELEQCLSEEERRQWFGLLDKLERHLPPN